jgi:hypothetical protein
VVASLSNLMFMSEHRVQQLIDKHPEVRSAALGSEDGVTTCLSIALLLAISRRLALLLAAFAVQCNTDEDNHSLDQTASAYTGSSVRDRNSITRLSNLF